MSCVFTKSVTIFAKNVTQISKPRLICQKVSRIPPKK